MQPALARKILMSIRTALGWGSLLVPGLVLRVFGVQGTLRAELKFALRLFGIRDVLMAYQLYQAQRHEAGDDELEETLRQGIAIDSIDAVSGLVAAASGGVRGRTVVMAVGTAVGAAGLGYLGREAPITTLP
jgi:hypothetical protein